LRHASGSRQVSSLLAVAALGGSLWAIATTPAQAFEVAAQAPSGAVRTQPDPFQKLQTLDAERIASTWSSVPDAEGCAGADRSQSGHLQVLADSSGEDATGGTDGTGSFDLLQPRYRLQADATVQHGCVVAQMAVQRRTSAEGDKWTWDGSALAWRIDPHWRVAAGTIAHQWGPSWDGSLILGTSSQPFLNASLLGQTGSLAESKLWWWLGEVELSVFFGQLENHRNDFNRPYLMGSRLVARPLPWLQLGFSRTAMWGGEGRDTSLKTFLKAALGRDNTCTDGDCSDQPGNQLAGYDLRLSLGQWLPGVALYGQMIGEDSRADDIPLPAKNMWQAGAEWRRNGAMAFVEWTDSAADYAGVAYNHFIYTDGYRYKGRPLGHWADGDSNLWTAGGLLPELLGGQALAVLRYGTLNAASGSPTWPTSRLFDATVQWRTVVDRVFGLSFALEYVRLSGLAAASGADGTDSDARALVQLDWWFR
jgi:hypothetical protein